MVKLPRLNLRSPRYGRGVMPLSQTTAEKKQRFGTNRNYIATNPETGEQRHIEGEGYGIYLMEPHKYLSLAAPLRGVDSPTGSYERARLKRIKSSVENVGLKSIPMLLYDSSKNEIVGHEGRHRAIVAQKMGKKLIPVEVKDIYRYQHPHFSLDTRNVTQESTRDNPEPTIREINKPFEEQEKKEIEKKAEANVERSYKTAIGKAQDKAHEKWVGFYNRVDDKGYGLKVLNEEVNEAAEREKRYWKKGAPPEEFSIYRYKQEIAKRRLQEKEKQNLVETLEGKMPGAIRPWVDAPKVTLKDSGRRYQNAKDLRSYTILYNKERAGTVNVYPDGDIADLYIQENKQRKGIGTQVVGQLLRTRESLSGEASESGEEFWKKKGADMDYNQEVMPTFSLSREAFEASQIANKAPPKETGPLNPVQPEPREKQVSPIPQELVSEPTEAELAFTGERPITYSSESPLERKVKRSEQEPEEDSRGYAGSDEEISEELESLYQKEE